MKQVGDPNGIRNRASDFALLRDSVASLPQPASYLQRAKLSRWQIRAELRSFSVRICPKAFARE